jgi:predicted RNA methylase
MIKKGEFFQPEDSNNTEIKVNLERYLYAMKYCVDKIVIEAGSGAGLGTYLYSLVAKKVFAVDYNDEHFELVKRYPQKCPVAYIKTNLEEEILPDADICVALEVIEHLKNPDFFLSQLKAKELVFSIPLDALAISPRFHKYDFVTIQDIQEIIGRYYDIEDATLQYGRWYMGYGKKKND